MLGMGLRAPKRERVLENTSGRARECGVTEHCAPRLAQRVSAERQGLGNGVTAGRRQRSDPGHDPAPVRRLLPATWHARLSAIKGANAYGHAEPFVPVDSKLAGVPGAAHLEAHALEREPR